MVRRVDSRNVKVCEVTIRDLLQGEALMKAQVKNLCSARGRRGAPTKPSARSLSRSAAMSLSRSPGSRSRQMTPLSYGGGTQSCDGAKARLMALQTQIRGERVKCRERERLQRKGELYEARAQREAQKTEIIAQRQQQRQKAMETKMMREEQRRARLETKMQLEQRRQAGVNTKMRKLEYRQARKEAGVDILGIPTPVVAVGAAGAAAFLLL